jgi:hypothetical protein
MEGWRDGGIDDDMSKRGTGKSGHWKSQPQAHAACSMRFLRTSIQHTLTVPRYHSVVRCAVQLFVRITGTGRGGPLVRPLRGDCTRERAFTLNNGQRTKDQDHPHSGLSPPLLLHNQPMQQAAWAFPYFPFDLWRTRKNHSSLFTPLFTLNSSLCTLHSALFTLHSALCTLHSALFTLHSALFTLHSALCTLHSSLFTYSSVKRR